jgi:hypothetical protein
LSKHLLAYHPFAALARGFGAWLERWLRPDLGTDRLQGLDAGREEVAVPVNEAVQFLQEKGVFGVG